MSSFAGKVGASNSELGNVKFGSNAPIDNTPRGFGQAQAKLNAFGQNKFGQAQAQILKSAGYGQSQADIKAINRGFGQTQADIKVVQPRFGQSQADIKAISSIFAQSNALIAAHLGVGQAQAKINAFDYPQFAQAQGRIAVFVSAYIPLIGNALLADFLLGDDTSSQSPPQGYGQAQAKLNAFGVNSFGQAQANITTIKNTFAQAQAFIGHFAVGQSQASIIVRTYTFGQSQASIRLIKRASGQATADILTAVRKFGQANADIKSFDVSRFGQAQTLVVFRRYTFGQAQAEIFSSIHDRFSQAQAKINAFGTNNSAQAGAKINAFGVNGYGQATGRVFYTRIKSGQAQGAIDYPLKTWGQAQAQIFGFPRQVAQANAKIIGRPRQYGQANALINARFKVAQAKAKIKTTSYTLAQAQARIKNKYYVVGQAKAYITGNIYHRYAQAQAYIGHFVWGQAQAVITDRKPHAQAQARIISFNTIQSGQAIADIIAPGYLVRYNRYQLPGYAQTEAFESGEAIVAHSPAYVDIAFSEYTGLENKIISIKMRTWEQTYLASKNQIELAATMLRSQRVGFTRLYIQTLDKYYLAMTKDIKVEKDVQDSAKILDYTVTFEAKPWLIANFTHIIIGSGVIDTDQVSRGIYNGTWTPARLLLSGTNITVSGYTGTGSFTGFLSVSGAVTNLAIDSEVYTATVNGVNKNNIMNNLDYAIFVGPGKTFFEVTGATSCVISWEDRWNL